MKSTHFAFAVLIGGVLGAGCGAQALVVGTRDGGPTGDGPLADLGGPHRADASNQADASVDPCLVLAGSVVAKGFPEWLMSGDVDGDGNIDLVVSSGDVFLGRGDGTFTAAPPLLAGAVPMVIGDVDVDGKLDLVGLTTDGTGVGIFLGKGDGTFGPPITWRTGAQRLLSVAIVDLDRDGRPDIAALREDYSAGDQVLVALGNGGGAFRAPVGYNTMTFGPYPSTGTVAAADVDGDGNQDLVTSYSHDFPISVLLGIGDGTLGSATRFRAGDLPTSMVIGDLDGNEIPDVVVSDSGSANVLLGKGDGTFANLVQYPMPGHPIALADIDGAGGPDLIYLTIEGGGGAGVLFNDHHGGFRAPVPLSYPPSYGAYPATLAIADMTGDHRPDVAIGDINDNKVHIFRNTCGN